jgi:hypothetical protein
MRRLLRFVAFLGLMWALLSHPIVFVLNLRNEAGRQIQAVAGIAHSLMKADLATNGVICMSVSDATNFVQIARDAAAASDGQFERFYFTNCISSLFIGILSICVLKTYWKDEDHAA